MRRSVKPVAVWPSNGAAYLTRTRTHPDSVNLRTSFNAHFSTQTTRPRHVLHIFVVSSRSRPLRKLGQLLGIRGGTRQLSASTRKESDDFEGFDEEDEEEIATSSSDISSVVRQRRKIAEARARQKSEAEQALMRRRQDLQNQLDQHANELHDGIVLLHHIRQNFETIRLRAEAQERAHEKWMRRYEQVIARSASAINVGTQALDEYVVIKYPVADGIYSYVNSNAIFVQHAEDEVSRCRQSLKRIGLASRRINLEIQLAQFEASLGSIVERLSDNHVTPAASAKRNIEKLVEPLFRFLSGYIQLQEAGFKITVKNTEIYLALQEIIAKRRDGKFRLEIYQKNIDETSHEIMRLLHDYRSTKRFQRWQGPLGKSHIMTMALAYSSYLTMTVLASDMEMDIDRLRDEVAAHDMTPLLAHWYLHRWKEGAPRSVDCDIAWRHLDIYHPFYLLSISDRMLGSEVNRLAKIIKVTGNYSSKSVDRLGEWKRKSDIMRANLLSDIEASSYYTWLRLETEDKVTRLGGVPDTIARGLFTPENPLSSDIRRFFLWMEAFCDGSIRSLNLDQATAKYDGHKRITIANTIELLDYTPSHRRGIGNLFQKETTQKLPVAPEEKTAPETTATTSQSETQETRRPDEQPPADRPNAKWTAKFRKQALINKYMTDVGGLVNAEVKESTLSTPARREYSTDATARAIVNDDGHECGVSEPGIALVNEKRVAENKDAARSWTSGAKPPVIMSSHGILDASEGSPVVATDVSKPQFWSYDQYKTPGGKKIGIHYCRTLEQAERAAALFSDSKVLGFDIEWKAQAQISSGIKSNVSLIQIANEERIALFHIALFKGNEINDLVPPSLKQLLESTDTVKVGVSIKADCSRVRRHLDIDTRGQFELSHLYKLVKYGSTQPKLVNRRAVNLAQQVEELLGLPLKKDDDVRKSDWTKPLDYTQVQYAASDAYACICLHNTLEAKRKALSPIPPLPAFAELNLPIQLAEEDEIEIEDKVAELSVRVKESLEVVETGEEDSQQGGTDETKNIDLA